MRTLVRPAPRTTAGARLGVLGAGGLALALLAWPLEGRPLAAPAVLALYLAAHAVRAVRTVVVLGDHTRSVRLVGLAHLASAAWTGLLPFKLGELVRMWAVGRASHGFGDGLRAVWIERTFDAVLIGLAAAFVVVLRPAAAAEVAPIALAAVAVLGLTATAVVALPENLGTAKHWLLTRYTARWSNRTLAVLDAASDAMVGLRGMVHGKIATLLVLSVLLWALEILAFGLLTGARGVDQLLVGVLGVLSGVLDAGPDGTAHRSAWRAVVLIGCGAMALVSALAAARRR